MAQHDYVIDNSTGANVRADINNALQAIASNNSGSSAPSTTYAFQLFADTSTGTMKIRNSANSAFIELFQLDGTFTLENGTESAPALAFRNDLNTGIFSGGADEFNISTGGTERLVIDSSGQVGIGTATPNTLLHVSDGAATVKIESTASGSSAKLSIKSTDNTYGGVHFGDDADLDVGRIRYYHSLDSMLFYTVASERMRIDSTGKVGIGTTSPAAKFHISDTYHFTVAGGNSTTGMQIGNYVTSTDTYGPLTYRASTHRFDISGSPKMIIDSSGNVGIGDPTPDSLLHIGNGINADDGAVTITIGGTAVNARQSSIIKNNVGGGDRALEFHATTASNNHETIKFFSDGINERMRLTSTGILLIGTTSSSNSDNALEVRNSNSGGALGVTSSNSSSQQDFILFKRGSGNTANGGIRRDGTTNGIELFSGSDRRIKTNIENMDNVLDKINQLSLKKYDFKDGSGSGVGLIAQDLINVFPNKVKKDASDDGTGDTVPDGVEPWTVGHNFTFEILKAIQELTARVEALEAA